MKSNQYKVLVDIGQVPQWIMKTAMETSYILNLIQSVIGLLRKRKTDYPYVW